MALRNDIPKLIDYVKENKGTLGHNAQLFDIWEGDLLQYILIDLRKQLSEQSFDQIQHRVSPINVLKRLIDKLAKIYNGGVTRYLVEDNEKDKDLLNWYIRTVRLDVNMALSNEFFNLFKNTLIESYVYKGKPAIRVIPSDRFLAYSDDTQNPTNPTHIIKLMGEIDKPNTTSGEKVELYYVYTNEEFLPITSDGEIMQKILDEANNPEGLNPYGKLPFVYINRSRHNIIPTIDTDTLKMTKIFPILLSDLNFSVLYQTFSIIYGVDVDDSNLTMSPNAFWRFKSDPTGNTKPEIGVIKPQVDISQVVTFIMAQLSFWLQSRNIRPGAVGQVSAENMASGVSKIVDDMDTFEDRQKQIPYFQEAEHDLFNLVLNHQWPYWIKEGMIEQNQLFEPGQMVITEFPEQQPLVSRTEILGQLREEMSMGLTTKKDAIMRLNPDMSEADAEEFLLKIDQENTVEIIEDTQEPNV